jgi:hypothetical protein
MGMGKGSPFIFVTDGIESAIRDEIHIDLVPLLRGRRVGVDLGRQAVPLRVAAFHSWVVDDPAPLRDASP